jgi:hypothetical protein
MTLEPAPALHTVEIVAVSPWSDVNEYEGTVEIAHADRRLHCRVVLPSGQWDTVQPGTQVTAALWLARTGDAELVEAAPALRHLQGVTYEATGRIERVDDEWVRLACGLALDVDLELTGALRQRLALAVGAQLRVVGALQLDLDPA